jgi:hypothetical protein
MILKGLQEQILQQYKENCTQPAQISIPKICAGGHHGHGQQKPVAMEVSCENER